LAFSLLSFSCISVEKTISLEGKRVVILGDSITNAGHYVSYLEYHLQKNNPKPSYDIISVGLSSETVSGLSEKEHPFPRPCVHTRLENVLKATKPKVLFACYGMNDGIYNPQSPERFDAYKKGYENFFKKAREYGVEQFILLTPPFYDSLPISKKTIDKGNFSYKTPFSGYNGVLSDYSEYLKALKYDDVHVVDLNKLMLEYVNEKRRTDPKFTLSRDGIHPGPEGHLLMANKVLKDLNYKFDLTGAADTGKIKSDPLFKLVAQKRALRSRGWLDYIGYTRGKTVKKDSVKEVEEKVLSIQEEIDKLRSK